MSSTHPPRRTSIRVVAIVTALLAGVALLASCANGDNDATDSTPAAGTGATGAPTSPAPPMTPVAPAPTPTAAAADAAAYGVVLVNVETGDVTALHEGAGPFYVDDALHLGSLDFSRALWLSPTTAEAVRYGPDGAVAERIEGWAVLEAPGGEARNYLVGDAAPYTVVVERGDERFEAQARFVLARAFSPDGTRFAWLEPADGSGGSVLHLLDLDTGESRVLAEDAGAPLEWSPSGQYLADGARVFDVGALSEPADPLRLTGDTLAGDAWLRSPDDEWVASISSSIGGTTITLTAMDTDDEIEFPLPVEANARAIALGDRFILVRAGFAPDVATFVFEVDFEDLTATPVRELRGVADVVLTADGLASVVIGRTELACTGIDIVHPALNERIPCEAEHAVWSPDGRYLALIPLSTAAPVELLEVATGERRELPHPGPRDIAPQWTVDSRALVWLWITSP